MHLDRIHRRLSELAEIGIETGEVTPASPESVAALEKALGFQIPAAVREFYLWSGEESGVFDATGSLPVSHQLKKDYRKVAREILAEAGEDPAIIDGQALVIDVDYDGNFSFVRADQGDDPPVYTHLEQPGSRMFCSCSRFTDHLALVLEQCANIEEVELVRTLDELKQLAQRRAHGVKHLIFSGELQFATVPDDVFALKELRSLSLVGKGLMELSPGIAELSFLKRLDVARNSLTTLPMALTELDELEDLDLSENQLTSVIGIIQKLPALRNCSLLGNPISGEEIDQMQSEFPDPDSADGG